MAGKKKATKKKVAATKKKVAAKRRKSRDITELVTGKRKTNRKKDKFLF